MICATLGFSPHLLCSPKTHFLSIFCDFLPFFSVSVRVPSAFYLRSGENSQGQRFISPYLLVYRNIDREWAQCARYNLSISKDSLRMNVDSCHLMGEINPLDIGGFHSQLFQIEGTSVITLMSHLISPQKY